MGRNAKNSLTLVQKAEISTLVKRANQRLRDLEKNGFTKEYAYSQVNNWNARGVKFMGTDSKGRFKFRTDVARMYKDNPKDYYELKRRVSEFLSLETSKTGEIKKKYKKASKTFERKYGIKLSPSQQKEVFASEKWKNLMKEYSSEDILDLVQMAGDDDETADGIKAIMDELSEEGNTPYSIEQRLARGESVRRF